MQRRWALGAVLLAAACQMEPVDLGGSVDPHVSSLTVDPAQGLNADGHEAATVTVTLKTASGRVIPGQTVFIAASGTGNSVTQAVGPTDAAGVAHGSLVSLDPGTKTVTVTSNPATHPVTLDERPTVTFVGSTQPPAQLKFLMQPMSATAGAALSAVAVAVQDAQGETVDASDIDVSLTLAPNAGALSGPTTTTAVHGLAWFTALTVTAPGTGYTLSASASMLSGATSAPFDVTASPVSATLSSVAAAPVSLLADGVAASTVTVTVRDALGRGVQGQTVALAATGAGAVLTQPAPTDAQGVTTGTLASTVVETKKLTATVGGTLELAQHPQVAFLSGAPDAAHSTFTVAPASVLADGTATALLTATIRDAQGHALAGQAVIFTVSGTGNALTAMVGATDAQGVFTSRLSSTHPESKLVAAQLGTFMLTAPVTFTWPVCGLDSMLTFPSVPWPVAGNAPRGVAIGDLNGDGELDVAAVNDVDSSLSVFLGAGGGAFVPRASHYISQVFGYSVVIGDWDDDGIPDLATAASVSGHGGVTLFIGNGDGTFRDAVVYPVPGGADVLAAGDLDGDGRTDLIAGSGNIQVLLRNGRGSFRAPVSLSAGETNGQMVVRDFDRDGHLDVAAISGATAIVLLGRGDGSFAALSPFVAGPSPGAVTAGDWNGDGKLDLAVANGSSTPTLGVLLGRGDGTFAAMFSTALSASPTGVTSADLNGDGKADLAVAEGSALELLLGGGDGTFTPMDLVPSGAIATSVTSADLDHDGRDDLVVTNWTAIAVLLANGPAGHFFTAAPGFDAGILPYALAAADWNGDGKLDVASANEIGDITVMLGNGDLTFREPLPSPGILNPSDLRAGDWNGDGKADLALIGGPTSQPSALRILLGKGDGTFAAGTVVATNVVPSGLVVEDFNGDGTTDLVVAGGQIGDVNVMLGGPGGTFQPPLVTPTSSQGSVVSFAAGDWNKDGKVDLAVSTEPVLPGGVVWVLLGKGDGTFQTPTSVEGAQGGLVSGDWNRDGNLDLGLVGDSIHVLMGHGDGTFAAVTVASFETVGQWPVTGDFNGDGFSDVMASRGSDVVMFLSRGDGSFAPGLHYAGGLNPNPLVAGDFNSDGQPDVVAGDFSYNQVRVLTRTGCVPITPPLLTASDAGVLPSSGHYLKPAFGDPGDAFGSSVAIWNKFVVVGAPLESSGASGLNGDAGDNSMPASGAAYLFQGLGDWHQAEYLKASNPDVGDEFGASVAVLGFTVVVGAPREDSDTAGVNHNAVESGAAYVFLRPNGIWKQQARLKASNADAFDGFGTSVAVSGNTIVVGAPHESSANGDPLDNDAGQAGAAYVFTTDDGGVWTQQAYLKVSNADPLDQFGGSVAIAGDLIVVGAVGEDSAGAPTDNSASSAGAAYVFSRTGTTWTQVAYLKAMTPTVGGQFGGAVAIDGTTVAIGATGDASSGAAYVFVPSGGTWAQQAYVRPLNAAAGQGFGQSLSIWRDTLVVGSALQAGAGRGVNPAVMTLTAPESGAAYVFSRAGSTWAQQAYLKAPNADPGDRFGAAVATSFGITVIGASREASAATGPDGNASDNSVADAGAVYTFE